MFKITGWKILREIFIKPAPIDEWLYMTEYINTPVLLYSLNENVQHLAREPQ